MLGTLVGLGSSSGVGFGSLLLPLPLPLAMKTSDSTFHLKPSLNLKREDVNLNWNQESFFFVLPAVIVIGACAPGSSGIDWKLLTS